MDGNKFAGMLQRNTHKLTRILIYAVLEWILIIFLLLNSLFTYLIAKFANYFGLKPPCPWCSRVDHILDPARNTTNSYTDLVCQAHALEISSLTYCSSHHKLAQTHQMCDQCLVPHHVKRGDDGSRETTQRSFGFLSWASTQGLESGDGVLKCSCCGESIRRELYPPCLLYKSSWSCSDYTPAGNLVIEAIDDDDKIGVDCKEQKRDDGETERHEACDNDDDNDMTDEFQVISDVDSFGLTDTAEENCSRSVSNLQYEEKEANEGNKPGTNSSKIIRCSSGEEDFLEIVNLGLGSSIDSVSKRVIPVELIDSSTTANQGSCRQTQAIEGSDPVETIEQLKRALSDVYAELEEERSASAVATNQTMAMITRLQEEKATMQMEALQYQRMMEEQSEYDQEALRLLNELMVKRDKEKQQLEKELEVYRNKVLEYEAKEKIVNSNHQVSELEGMALDCVNHMRNLDDTLMEFEEERVSILDQLKVLEEKIVTLGDEEFVEDLRSMKLVDNGCSSSEKETLCLASMARQLLPYVDETQGLTLDEEEKGEFQSGEMQKTSVSIEEEVDNVYERLEALEADKEFLKHCMRSINNGDKGMDLLQEILQHLRDLRAVDSR